MLVLRLFSIAHKRRTRLLANTTMAESTATAPMTPVFSGSSDSHVTKLAETAPHLLHGHLIGPHFKKASNFGQVLYCSRFSTTENDSGVTTGASPRNRDGTSHPDLSARRRREPDATSCYAYTESEKYFARHLTQRPL